MYSHRRIVRKLLMAVDKNPTLRRAMQRLAIHSLLPTAVWQRLTPGRDITVQVGNRQVGNRQVGNRQVGNRQMIYVSEPNDVIGNALYWTGQFEPETTSVFLQLAEKANTVLDVGANTGYFTLLAAVASPTTRIVSFEPVPAIFELLQRNVARNGWAERCTLHNVAVADRSGVTSFHIPDGFYIPTSASLDPAGYHGSSGHLVQIAVTTLDAIVDATVQVDLIKIDVEGFEDLVLRGSEQLIARCLPDIIVECNPDGPYTAVQNLLRAQGYWFYHLQGKPLTPLDHIAPDMTGKYRNFLCSAALQRAESILQHIT